MTLPEQAKLKFLMAVLGVGLAITVFFIQFYAKKLNNYDLVVKDYCSVTKQLDFEIYVIRELRKNTQAEEVFQSLVYTENLEFPELTLAQRETLAKLCY